LCAGFLTDHGFARAIIIGTQASWAILCGALVLLGSSHAYTTSQLLLFASLIGLVNGIDAPVRQVLSARLVKTDEIGNAVSLNSMVYDAARMFGPAVGGVLLAHAAGNGLFMVCFALHLCACTILLSVNFRSGASHAHIDSRAHTKTPLDPASLRGIFSLLFLLGLVALGATSYTTLLPLKAVDLEGGSRVLGMLWSAIGCGAITGGLAVGLMGRITRPIQTAAASVIFLSIALFSLASSHALAVCLASLALAGFSAMLLMVCSSTFLLTATPLHQHGKVLAWFTLSFMVPAPFGSLIEGWIAAREPLRLTITGNAAIALVAVLLFWLVVPSAARRVRATEPVTTILPEPPRTPDDPALLDSEPLG
jgi:MFS family permease